MDKLVSLSSGPIKGYGNLGSWLFGGTGIGLKGEINLRNFFFFRCNVGSFIISF